ncbi:hypothetical protein UFOVP229_65 [uncultured Caudovirales phage]|uniref:Glycine-rich domain-containing protein n=1 Tax=uncultured Caudovirales phage TaxID=2100421 RepID=A0A6J7WNA2_9CAUD|nr:hypothetical protein UFOVP229_65 [uncultured Caudovirales phage]
MTNAANLSNYGPFVAPGTSGNVLTSNGSAWTSAAAASGYGGTNFQLFTASGTFTVPAGITKLTVTAFGGGAGGFNTLPLLGGSGGAGVASVTVTPGAAYTVTVGSGGRGYGASSGAAQNGGTTSFGSLVTATGGTTAGALGSFSTTGTVISSAKTTGVNLYLQGGANGATVSLGGGGGGMGGGGGSGTTTGAGGVGAGGTGGSSLLGANGTAGNGPVATSSGGAGGGANGGAGGVGTCGGCGYSPGAGGGGGGGILVQW